MKIKKYQYILFLALILFGTVSCGTAKQVEYAWEAQKVPYIVEKEVAVDIDEALLQNCYIAKQYIYYMQAVEGRSSIWRQELAEGAEAVRVCSFEENEIIQAFAVTDAGNVIAAVRSMEQGSVELRKIDRKGDLLWRSEFPERQEAFIISGILLGSDGRIYAAAQQELFFWNASGEFERSLTVRGELIQHLADAGEGKISVVESRQRGQALTVYQETDGKEVFQKDFKEGQRWLGNGLYYLKTDMLVRYHWDSDSREAVVNFTDCGIDISSIRILHSLEEGRFLVGIVEEGESGVHFVYLTADEGMEGETEGEAQSPTRLLIATFNPQNLQSGIVRFNRSHDDYELVTEVFDTDLSVVLDQMVKFNIYIASANPPDIIDIFGEIFYHAYARDGYLLDLTPFIEKSEKISLDDFLPRVMEDIAVNGKLYTIPRTIYLTALACPTELLAGKTSWTIEEYLDLLEQYPNALSGNGASAERVKGDILRKALYEGINGFIDWETGEAFFDGEEFSTLLERIDGLKVNEISQSRQEMAQNGEVVFWDLYLHRTNELLQAEWMCGQELTLIGFPVSGKNQEERSHNHIGYSEMMSIHSASKEPEAAWDYLEEYITGALLENDYVVRTGKEIFEEKIQEDVGVETWTLEGTLPAATQEQADKVRNAFMEGIYYSGENKPLLDIIAEETEPYFRGEKELEDVTGIIQNRIQIYLDERK